MFKQDRCMFVILIEDIIDVSKLSIDPKKFIDIDAKLLLHTNDKWFVNLLKTDIPSIISNLLQLNFSLLSTFNKKLQFMSA